MRGRVILASACLLAMAAMPASASGTTAGLQHVTGSRVIDFEPGHASAAATSKAAFTSVKRFTRTVDDGGAMFTYTMVGKDPFVAQTAPSTTVETQVVPLKIVLGSSGDSFDPGVATACDPGSTATARSLASPVFTNRAYTLGGTAVGKGQYVDIFRRAEFWSQAAPTGINPGYHLKLKATTLATQTVNVPLAEAGETAASSCGETTGAVEVHWLENYLETTLLPSLKTQGLISETTFPVFLVHNVVMYDTTTVNCCILGFHSYTSTAAGRQTYGIADYESSGRFPGFTDVSVLSHEIAEWADDPFGFNPTRPWGHLGQVSGCQSNLENGDPLSGTTVGITKGGFTYHPQELAFFSWFYHSSPSLGVNGWFSNNGTFRSAAAPCT